MIEILEKETEEKFTRYTCRAAGDPAAFYVLKPKGYDDGFPSEIQSYLQDSYRSLIEQESFKAQ